MKKLIFAVVVGVVMLLSPAGAQSGPKLAIYKADTRNFSALAGAAATISGCGLRSNKWAAMVNVGLTMTEFNIAKNLWGDKYVDGKFEWMTQWNRRSQQIDRAVKSHKTPTPADCAAFINEDGYLFAPLDEIARKNGWSGH